MVFTAVLEFYCHIPCYEMTMKILMNLIFVMFVYMATIMQFMGTTSFHLTSRILEEVPIIAINTFNLVNVFVKMIFELTSVILEKLVTIVVYIFFRLVVPNALRALNVIFQGTVRLITSVPRLVFG